MMHRNQPARGRCAAVGADVRSDQARPVGQLTVDAAGRILRASAETELLLGSPSGHLLDAALAEYIAAADRSALEEGLKRASGGGFALVECTLLRRDLAEAPLDCFIVRDSQLPGDELSCFLIDASGRRPVAARASDSAMRQGEWPKREKEIFAVVESEFERLARDLHDTLGQHITGLSMLHGALVRRLMEKDRPEAAMGQQIAAVLEKAREELRRISQSVHGIGEDGHSLWSRIHEFAAAAQGSYGISCSFRCDEPVKLVPFAARQLVRIVEETVVNAVSARGASEVTIRLRRTPESYLLEIADDGDGPECAASEATTSMMEARAQALGGTLEVSRRRPRGRVTRCTVPVDPETLQP